MTRKIYNLLAEPCGEVYFQLLKYALPFCDQCLLVVQRGFGNEENILSKTQELRKYMVSEYLGSSWPGTTLGGSSDPGATILRYRFCHGSMLVLSRCADRLYSWLSPHLPEDLCLIRPDGQPWLVTISHEQDGYFEITQNEAKDLCTQIPHLEIGL